MNHSSNRIPALDPATTTGKAKDLLAAVQAKFGATPNLFKVAANAPPLWKASSACPARWAAAPCRRRRAKASPSPSPR